MKSGVQLPRELAQKLTDPEFIAVQSYLYENYVKEMRPKEWSYWTRKYYTRRDQMKGNEINEFWYQISFKDGNFLSQVKTQKAYPDLTRYKKWEKNFNELEDFQKRDFSGLFGVSNYGKTWSHYITYQFIHSGFLHMISNMMILILFGILIEIQMGSVVVLILYLVGGSIGAAFYDLTTGSNLAPLIGASGSVSALLAFYLFTEPRKYVRFFYFFFPAEGNFGDIYLSKWWLVPLLIINDVNAVLTVPDWSLNVAHTAHIGAILFGSAMALILKIKGIWPHLGESLTWVVHPEEEAIASNEHSSWS